MIGTAERLRLDWFRRFMLDPGRIVSGTAMPRYFTEARWEEGEKAIARMWAALSMGGEMPKPDGAGASLALGIEALPAPAHEAVIQRFPMPGATAAAIAVGMPRQGKDPGVSYCFDAADCRLVYAWQGGFIDLRGSLAKKMAYPEILGQIFYRTGAFPFRTGKIDSVPRRRFRGYRIADGFPEFRYEIDGIDVRERIVPLRPERGFAQEFRIEGVDSPLWFVVEANQKVTLTSTVGVFENGVLKIPPGENVRFDVKVAREEKP